MLADPKLLSTYGRLLCRPFTRSALLAVTLISFDAKAEDASPSTDLPPKAPSPAAPEVSPATPPATAPEAARDSQGVASEPAANSPASSEHGPHEQAPQPNTEGTGTNGPPEIETPHSTPPLKRAENSTKSLKEPSAWHFGGYGELILANTFYHPALNQNVRGYRDSRLDLARFAFEMKTHISEKISFKSEIEFEHGGTGVAREIEWEEFGEYETEVEKGGEVVIEELVIEGRPLTWLTLRAGHLIVPIGMTARYHRPNLFSTARRPESETQLLPSLWHENGVELGIHGHGLSARFQALTGLDSTGFSSSRFIALGTQRAFESPLINNIATVATLDYVGLRGTLVGFSLYTSGSNQNRPKRDLYDVSGRVTLGDVHVRFQRGPLKLRGVALLGHIQNAAAISRANASLSSNLGASRSAVASAAYAAWVEAAYDVVPFFAEQSSHKLDVFARFDAYDTMWRAGAEFDNPLMQRRTITTGLNYFPHERVVLKAEYAARFLNENRSFDRRQNEVNAALGFVL